MRRVQLAKAGITAACAAFLFLAPVCPGHTALMKVQAEESGLTEDFGDAGEIASQEVYTGEQDIVSGDSAAPEDTASFDSNLMETYETEMEPGTYTMEDGWTKSETQSSDEVTVYVQDAYAGTDMTETSTISCSYLETNYSRQDYEQLRDMLTNNLLYSNVDAQITTSAVYTLAMDYLYIILVDDSSEDYRDIFHYVVGDYQCFCVEVKEYRREAEEAEAQDLDTPREIGQKVAEGFIWN